MSVHLNPRRLLSALVVIGVVMTAMGVAGRPDLPPAAAEPVRSTRPADAVDVADQAMPSVPVSGALSTTTTTAPPPPPEPVYAPVLRAAVSALGTPYRYGGTGNGGFDCSGLVQWAWARAGVALPRTTYAQRDAARPVTLEELQPGDLVFYFGTSHMGLYIGDGQVIHAPSSGKRVEVVPMVRGGMSPSGYARVA